MATPDLVDARWVAGYEAELPDKTVLVPGETVVQIGAGEAEASDNWEVVGSAKPRKPRRTRGRKPPKPVEPPKAESADEPADAPVPEPESTDDGEAGS